MAIQKQFIQLQSIQTIAIFPSLEAIGAAIDQLVLAGFPLAQIFLIGKDTRAAAHHGATGRTTAPAQELLHATSLETLTGVAMAQQRGAMMGNLTGGIVGLLAGLGTLVIPGIGEMVAGSLFLYLLSTTGIGSLAGGTLGAYFSRKMTTRLVKNCMSQVYQGSYLLIVSGTKTEIFWAEQILFVGGIQLQRLS
jgi:hypothetical protein